MQRLRIFFLACALMLCIGSSCTNPLQPVATPQEFVSLKIGNEWSYEVANYLPVFNDTLIRRFTSRIVADTIIEGKKYFIENIYAGSLITSIVTNMSDGYYLRMGNRNSLVQKFPAKLGDKYQVKIYDSAGQISNLYNVEVTALNKEITVEAGKFQCYEETYVHDSFKYVNHLAGTYGTIQQLIYDSTNTLVARGQLTSYTIQK